MTAYIIFTLERMRDPELYKAYAAKAVEARADFNYKPLVVYEELETLEGAAAEGVVMIEFETMARAREWYHSDKYREARALRNQAADFRVVLVQGK